MENDILKNLISEERYDYKCFELLKNLFWENDEFRKFIIEGYQTGKVYGFPEELWAKIASQNIRRIPSFEDVFRDGANIGYCTVAAKQLSYSLDDCYLCGGRLELLKGTPNCEMGNHTWIFYKNSVIDTSLMLIIEKDYSKNIGFIEENRYNPNLDPLYLSAKEFTRDKNLISR